MKASAAARGRAGRDLSDEVPLKTEKNGTLRNGVNNTGVI